VRRGIAALDGFFEMPRCARREKRSKAAIPHRTPKKRPDRSCAMNPLHEVCGASIPAAALPALAGVRAGRDIEVTEAQGRAWVRWHAGDEEVLRRLLPVAGVELFVQRGGLWYRHGCHLPAFGVPPKGESRPLDRVLFPAPVVPVPPPNRPPPAVPLRLTP